MLSQPVSSEPREDEEVPTTRKRPAAGEEAVTAVFEYWEAAGAKPAPRFLSAIVQPTPLRRCQIV